MESRLLKREEFVYVTDRNAATLPPNEFKFLRSAKSGTLISFDHPGWRNAGIYDNGGPFSVTADETIVTPSKKMFYKLSSTSEYPNRTFYAVPVNFEPTIFGQPSVDLGSYGAEAWNRMRPDKPEFEILNFIHELRELPRQLQQRFTRDLKGIGNFHVAVQFGWRPLLRDVQELVRLQIDAQKRLEQLIRDNGRPVRRRAKLRSVNNEQVTIVGQGTQYQYPSYSSSWYSSLPKQTSISGSRTEVWASARFRYWLPPMFKDSYWTKMMLARIYGLNPTPSVVYNAIPWSWLIDWFSNVGDVIENLSAGVADRLAADYFYIMGTHELYAENKVVSSMILPYQPTPIEVECSGRRSKTIKSRIKGSPFGFSIKDNELSLMQLSILGALGLSKLR